ncbi:MAG: TetR/AcrR family transcriptional regulator [Pseudomonadaceae bacterium]|nr:MAG: TetR/AcrR family transcriptional regulator [Pseudomonadaceae bacterium]
MSTRRDEEKQQRHDAILDAAETMFFSKGYERSSMQDIAHEAGLSRALLYVYFTDKPAIMRGIILRAVQDLCARFAQAIAAGNTGLEQIGNIGRAYFQFSQDKPDYFDALTQVSAFIDVHKPDALTLELAASGEQIMHNMIYSLENGLVDGSISPERVTNPIKTAYFLRGAMHGVIMQSRLRTPGDSNYPEPVEMIEYTLQMQKHALAP